MRIGAPVAVVLVTVGTVMWVIAAAGTVWAQRRMPGLARLPLVQDRGFVVILRDDLARMKAAARRLSSPPEEPEPSRLSFAEIKPDIERFIEEGRRIYSELDSQPQSDRVGALYDEARDWGERVEARLSQYHSALAEDFREGGYILSPQIDEIQPTDRETLMIYVRRRGQILRNVLDGTPRANLTKSMTNP